MATPYPESRRVVYACLALRGAEALGYALMSTPFLQLLESNVCRNYYRHRKHDDSVVAVDGSTFERLCKVAQVQSDISHLNGVNSIVTLLPALIGALLCFGLCQFLDKKIILLANVTGSFMMDLYLMAVLYFYNTFDPRWMWLAGIFNLIGGGDLIFAALLQTFIAETIPNHSLSTFYLYSTALALVAVVTGSASSLSLMNTSLWLPMILGVIVKSLNIPMVLLFVGQVENGLQRETAEFHLLPTEDHEMQNETESSIIGLHSQTKPIWRQAIAIWSTLHGCLFHLAVCVSQEAGNSFRGILPYWLSREYHWTLQETGYIFLGEKLLTALLISLLPHVPKWVLLRGGGGGGGNNGQGIRKATLDLNLARLCLCLACLGTALLGFRWSRMSAIFSLAVLATGTGFRDAYLSYVTAKLQKHEIVMVCTALSMAQYSSINFGVFVIGGLYSFCLKLDRPWMASIPIWLCSLVLAFTVLLLRRSV